jgi:hypothetical protein
LTFIQWKKIRERQVVKYRPISYVFEVVNTAKWTFVERLPITSAKDILATIYRESMPVEEKGSAHEIVATLQMQTKHVAARGTYRGVRSATRLSQLVHSFVNFGRSSARDAGLTFGSETKAQMKRDMVSHIHWTGRRNSNQRSGWGHGKDADRLLGQA